MAYYEGVNEHDLNATVLRLRASSTSAQVKEAMCADINASMGLQTEQQAYALAARRNGWHYAINTVTNLNCTPPT